MGIGGTIKKVDLALLKIGSRCPICNGKMVAHWTGHKSYIACENNPMEHWVRAKLVINRRQDASLVLQDFNIDGLKEGDPCPVCGKDGFIMSADFKKLQCGLDPRRHYINKTTLIAAPEKGVGDEFRQFLPRINNE